MSTGSLAYLDASAFVKLVAAEPESAALAAEVGRWPNLVASFLLEVEARRFAQRAGGRAPVLVAAALRKVGLVAPAPSIRTRAAALRPPTLGSLDALHLATALALGRELAVMFAYDRRLLEAARLNGVLVSSPSA